jgi:hypothetical protein
MMRFLNLTFAAIVNTANAGCLFGSGARKGSHELVFPNNPHVEYASYKEDIQQHLKKGEDVLMVVTAPFNCPPCNAVKSMFANNKDALAELEKKYPNMKIKIHNPAKRDEFSKNNMWAEDTLMRDHQLASMIQSYPSLIHYSADSFGPDGFSDIHAPQVMSFAVGDGKGTPAKVEQWGQIMAALTKRSEEKAKMNEKLAEIAIHKDIPADFNGFVVFVDNKKARWQHEARKYAYSLRWLELVPQLGMGEVRLVVADEKKDELPGFVALYENGELKTRHDASPLARPFYAFADKEKRDAVEPMRKLIRDLVGPLAEHVHAQGGGCKDGCCGGHGHGHGHEDEKCAKEKTPSAGKKAKEEAK